MHRGLVCIVKALGFLSPYMTATRVVDTCWIVDVWQGMHVYTHMHIYVQYGVLLTLKDVVRVNSQ